MREIGWLAGGYEATTARIDRVRARLGISWSGLLAVAVAVAAILGCALVLASVSEDVLTRDGIARRDPAWLHLLIAHRSIGLVDAARWATTLGDVQVLVALALVAAAFLWFRGTRLLVAAAPALSLTLAGIVVAVVKPWVGRGRPPVALRLVTETEASFPSGHATDSAALYLTVALIAAVVLLRRPLGRALVVAAAGLIVAAVGVSRLVLGVHWPTDVIVGWALGSLVALVVTTATVLASAQPARPARARTRHHPGRLSPYGRRRPWRRDGALGSAALPPLHRHDLA